MRPMTTALKWHIRQDTFNFAVLCEIDHPTGLVNLWSGTGTLDHDGKEWLGVGHIGGIQGVEETSQLAVSEVQLFLTNVPEEELDLASVDIKGRSASIWWAGMTPDRRVVPDPLFLAQIDLDYSFVRTEANGANTIVLVGQTGFWVLEQPSSKSWTPEEQKVLFPDDTGFDRVAGLVDREVPWTPT